MTRGETDMLLLGITVLLLGGYLVYALAHPERF
ncbi:MAG: potassium-transporting ATPase subunit F [Oscillospiraceae bacterium]|nr:potassium-transporting ATPase subunit F [Oscillospiraceae bacterium]